MRRLFIIIALLGILFALVSAIITICRKNAKLEKLVYLKVIDAVASSFDETPDWAPKPDPLAAVDGNLKTRWSPKLGIDNEWIYFDFGRQKTMSKIIIRWEKAYALDYEILISSDLEKWRRVILMKNQDGGIDEMSFSPKQGRYVKLVGLKRSNSKWGFSMWEFEMYGPRDTNPDDKTLEEVYPLEEETVEEGKKEEVILVPQEPLPSPGPIGENEFHRGIVYTSWETDELLSEESDQTVQYLYRNNVRHISLVVNWYQAFQDSTQIFPQDQAGGKTSTDQALGHTINLAHLLGMKVVLNPHLDVEDGTYRGDIIPSKEWFASYRKFLLHYAGIATKYNVELLSIGTELTNTTTAQWESDWREIIQEVKNVYKGPLIYAANWNEYLQVPFWDCLDFIGIDAYFPLTSKDDPNKEELIAAWESRVNDIETWREAKGFTRTSVIFTELGYDTVDGSNKEPWRLLPTSAKLKEDQQEQTDCLDAALVVLTKRPWFRGLYWWNYFPKAGVGPLGYTLRGKLGEKVLKDWYGKL